MSVTREMIAAGHAVTMKRGDVILSADLLTAIYKAMAARRPRVTYVCEVCNAGMVPALGELGSAQEVCDCMDDARRDHMARMEAKMFAPGAFVMLHHECKVAGKPHEDAGRIGRIVSRDGASMVTEFWNDDLIGGATFCLIPFGHWAPVPEFCVEEYEPRAKRRGWRLNERGAKLFADMGWQRTKATIGDA